MRPMLFAKLLRRALIFALLVACASCLQDGRFGALGAAACPPLMGGGDPLSMNFSANARANAKVRAFVAASKDLIQVSLQMEATAADACQRMGRDLGVPEAEMTAHDDQPGARARAACNAVGARIDMILRQGIQVRVQAEPPVCQVDAQAKMQCEGACNVEVDPGQIVAQCEPARLSGYCQGRCVGGCEGTCNGDCQGNCTMRDAAGRCVGRCDGTCSGSCDATCHARCEGQWQAPRCEGMVRPPSADAECNASCNARASFRAQCQPARVAVSVSQGAEMAGRLAATLQANLPALLHAQIALGKRMLGDVRVVVDVGAQLPKVVGDAGAQALACIAAGAQASVQASARIQVSVEASASVSGRVGAG
jgi:hypothetical protein